MLLKNFAVFFGFFFVCTAIADTESFDMVLMGGFEKDYCEIIYTPGSTNVTLDTENGYRAIRPEYSPNFTAFHLTAARGFVEINCSAGTYSVAISHTETDVAAFYDDVIYSQHADIFKAGYPTELDVRVTNNVNMSEDVTISSDGLLAAAYLHFWVVPVDDNIAGLPDTFGHTFTNIVTIERK